MKFTTFYPSVVTSITCPNCGAEGRVKRERPPREDFTVLCPQCKDRFLAKINVRSSYRKNVSIPVSYSLFHINTPKDQKARRGTIVDISQQGIGVRSHPYDFSSDYYKQGSLFSFLFSLPPRKDLLKVQGEVRRISKEKESDTWTMGVQLSNLDNFTNKQIGFFLLP